MKQSKKRPDTPERPLIQLRLSGAAQERAITHEWGRAVLRIRGWAKEE